MKCQLGTPTRIREAPGRGRVQNWAMSDTDQSTEDPIPPLGRRARKALATRAAMFEAGLSSFENRPLGVVSVLDITEATDVAKGVFYLHFGGKDEYLIALWQFVQRAFLDAVRAQLDGCRSRRGRLDGAVAHYFRMIAASPRECRFWLRMSSYFGDEIGPPGQLGQLRQEYLGELASLIAGAASGGGGEKERRIATVIDGTCWGLISQTIQHGTAPLEEEYFVKVVMGAIRSLR